ncbi:DIS3-like exonuclease 2 isoform X1 [Argonauta hians]
MAHRGCSKQLDYQTSKNTDNQQHNQQYRAQFKQMYPHSPNGILGNAPHNFTPVYKMATQGQPPPPPLPNKQINHSPQKIQDIEEQVKNNPNLIIGEIRINPKDYKDCYIPHPDGHSDIYICGTKNRNSALNGDRVLVLLNDKSKWKVNKKELDSNFTSESEDEDIDQLLANTSIKDDPAIKEAIPAGFSSSHLTQASIPKGLPPTTCSETSDDSKAIANVDMNTKRITPKKDQSMKKYTSVGDLNPGVNLQKMLEDQKNSEIYIQRTGKVVSILEAKHPRKCVGHLGQANNKFVRFNPIDSRIPRLSIPLCECPKEYLQRPEDFSRVLFVAKILDQNAAATLTHGSLLQCLGQSGDIETETKGILIENDVDDSEFPDSALDSLPIELNRPWTVSREEYKNRRDLTNMCIFTIDPASARDLDDAVSCEVLPDKGLFEIGVHIADVSYFLKESTSLDKIAASRATSVYLTQKVIPMLPKILCEKLCSLNPNEPRLCFSVIWHINEKAEIVNEWFGRTVINSCAKLSYDHAQGFINDPSREYTADQLPTITGFSINDIKTRVLKLHKIASLLRKKRFEDGALRLDKVKLQWLLNDETQSPMGYFVHELKESNRLIEEFMLLANMAVAHRIHKSFPEKCLLRRHPEPQTKMIDSLNDFCKSTNIEINVSSAGGIHKSLLQFTDGDEYSLAKLQVLVAKCSKPMKLAVYFCSGTISDKNDYRHYALNVPLYTHFTSPIRRYADVIVHRLLAAALGYTSPIQQSEREMETQARHCNDKKAASKRAQELSCEIFLAAFIQASGPLFEKGMVMTVLDQSFDVYILRLGVVKRVYCNKLDIENHTPFKRKKLPMLRLQWNKNEHIKESVNQEIGIFTLVKCILKADSEPLKWSATITHPDL